MTLVQAHEAPGLEVPPAKRRPYKTSFRRKAEELDILSQEASQEVNIAGRPHESHDTVVATEVFIRQGGQNKDSQQRRRRNAVANAAQYDQTRHEVSREGSLFKDGPQQALVPDIPEGGAFDQGEEVPAETGAGEDLVLWPPPGETLPAGAAPEAVVPAFINARLLPHQREGVRFLYMLYRENRGGILGDDMGLGKTIQTIAFLGAILKKKGRSDYRTTQAEKQVLIVTPSSVLDNWKREFEAWGPSRIGIYHGNQRESVLRRVKSGDIEICLTSKDTLVRCMEELNTVEWDCVFVDEAHVLKNDNTDLYRALNSIRTRKRFGLTGTVLQNKYKELWCIFQWASENSLGSRKTFYEYYEHPLKLGQRFQAPQTAIRLAKERQAALLRALRPHFLRRTKDETIAHSMRGKVDNVIFCAMSPLQQRAYRRVLQSADFQLLVRLNEPCDCGSGDIRGNCCHTAAEDGILYRYMHEVREMGPHKCPYCMTLPCLQVLLKISNHLELIKPDPHDPPDKRDKDRAFAAMALGEDAAATGGLEADSSFLGLSDTQHCGKMRALESLLAAWKAQGDKVLLFSHSVRMLNILERLLIRRGYSHLRLDGSTPQASRQGLCDDFNNSQSRFVFLISTRAGGLGLNLVGANRVVIFDPSWNPSFDLQAQDRSFRYGQTRHVTVYRLMTAGSIEEIVYNRQIYKQQQFNTAMHGPGERRYFEGVQDRKDMQGEIFGISNLFQDLADKVFTSDVLEREERFTRVTEDLVVEALVARGGAPNFSQTLADGRDEHGLDELARMFEAEVAGDTARGQGSELPLPKSVPNTADVPEVLRGSGVLYAHRNEEVVGKGGRPGERAGASWAWNDAANLHVAPAIEVRESGARRMLADAGRGPAVGNGNGAAARPRRQRDEDAEGGRERQENDPPGGSAAAAPGTRAPKRRRHRFVEEETEAGSGGDVEEVGRNGGARDEDDVATLRFDDGPGNREVGNRAVLGSHGMGQPGVNGGRRPLSGRGTDTSPRGESEDDMATLRVTGLSAPGDDDPTLRMGDEDLDDVATLRMGGGGLADLQQVYDTQKTSLFDLDGGADVSDKCEDVEPAPPVEPQASISERKPVASAGLEDKKTAVEQKDKGALREKELILKEMARMRGTTVQETYLWFRSKGNVKERIALEQAARKRLKEEGKI